MNLAPRPFPRLGIQMWTLRDDWQRDPIATLERLAALGYQGVELYGDLPLPAETLREVLERLGLAMAALHVGDRVDIDLESRMREARILGHDHFVFSFSPHHFLHEESAVELARLATARCEALAARGFRMSLHHHAWEFTPPDRGMRFLDACGPIGLEFDLYWLATAGLDPVDMVRRHAPDLRLLHAKDGLKPYGLGPACGPMTALGEGSVPVHAALVEALNAGAPVEWLLFEMDEGPGDVWDAVARSLKPMAAVIKSKRDALKIET